MEADKEAAKYELIRQERINEANLDEALSAAAEKAAETIAGHDLVLEQAKQALKERDEHIAKLELHDSDVHKVVSDGSAARSERVTRKQKALDALNNALKKAGVIATVLLIVGIVAAAWHFSPSSTVPVQVASPEAPPAGFPTRSAA